MHIQPHMIVLVVVAVCFTGLLRGVERPQGFTCAWSRPAFSLVTAESPSVATSRWENRVVPQAMVVVRLLRIFFVREMADVLVYAALPGSALHFPRAARATGAGDSRTTARHGWSPTVPRISRITAETDIRLPRELSSFPDTTSFLLSTQLRAPTQLRSYYRHNFVPRRPRRHNFVPRRPRRHNFVARVKISLKCPLSSPTSLTPRSLSRSLHLSYADPSLALVLCLAGALDHRKNGRGFIGE